MAIEDIFKVVLLILASFGGGALVVLLLASYLGRLWAARILQSEKASFDTKLEALRHEFGIAKSSYEHHLDLILDYYQTVYRQYRICQRTASADAHRELPDGEVIYTKDEFVAALGPMLAEWAAQEGRVRLLLPAKLLGLHEEMVAKLNDFKRAVWAFSPSEGIPRKKEMAFKALDEVKSKLESGLREYLRTETLLK